MSNETKRDNSPGSNDAIRAEQGTSPPKNLPMAERSGGSLIPHKLRGHAARAVYGVGVSYLPKVFKAKNWPGCDERRASRFDGLKVHFMWKSLPEIAKDAEVRTDVARLELRNLQRLGYCTCVRAPRQGRPGKGGSTTGGCTGIYIFHFEPEATPESVLPVTATTNVRERARKVRKPRKWSEAQREKLLATRKAKQTQPVTNDKGTVGSGLSRRKRDNGER